MVSIILLEYKSQLEHTDINSITLEEYENFLISLRKPRGTIAGCVRNILDIICGNTDVSEAAQNLIATWIRRVSTLTSTLFIESKMDVRERPLESKNVYPNYKIKINYWYLLGDRIQPKKTTIAEIKLLMKLYGFPKNPSDTKWTYVDINFKGLPSKNIGRKLGCITNTHEKRKKYCNTDESIFDYGESSMKDNVKFAVADPKETPPTQVAEKSTDVEYCDKLADAEPKEMPIDMIPINSTVKRFKPGNFETLKDNSEPDEPTVNHCNKPAVADPKETPPTQVAEMSTEFEYCDKLADAEPKETPTIQVAEKSTDVEYCDKLAVVEPKEKPAKKFKTKKVKHCDKLADAEPKEMPIDMIPINSTVKRFKPGNFETLKDNSEPDEPTVNHCNKPAVADPKETPPTQVAEMSTEFEYCDKPAVADPKETPPTQVAEMSTEFEYCDKLAVVEPKETPTIQVAEKSTDVEYCDKLAVVEPKEKPAKKFKTKKVKHCDKLAVVEPKETPTIQVAEKSTDVEYCDKPVGADQIKFEKGTPVNVTHIGYPYYAAIVIECDENYVTVKFPNSTNIKHHKYPIKSVQPFKPQTKEKKLI